MYKLLSGSYPFAADELLDEHIQHQEIDVFTSSDPVWGKVSEEAKDLVTKLLNKNPQERISTEEALQHRWFHKASLTPRKAKDFKPALDGTMIQRLQLFSTLNPIQQKALNIAATSLSAELKQNLLLLYTEISHRKQHEMKDGSQASIHLNIDDLGKALHQFGYRVSPGEVKILMSRIDSNMDGTLDMNEFCSALIDWHEIQTKHPVEWKNAVQTAFDEFDANSDGRISIDEIRRSMPEIRSNQVLGDVERDFTLAASNSNGYISTQEFERMLRFETEAWGYFASRVPLDLR